MRRTDVAYTTLDWTDKVITTIEIITLVGTVRAVFKQTAKKMIAKGLSQAAARNVAIAHAAAHVGTAAASALVVGGVVPKLLVDAGLDEADVRAGLAVFGAVFTIVGIRAARNQARRTRNAGQTRPPKAGRDQEGVLWDTAHPLIEGVPDAGRTDAHRFLQQAVADEMQADGAYVRVGMGRKLSEFSGKKHSPDIKPDNIGLTKQGTIDMFEIQSPSQTRKQLENKLKHAMGELPVEMRGAFRVIDPEDASE